LRSCSGCRSTRSSRAPLSVRVAPADCGGSAAPRSCGTHVGHAPPPMGGWHDAFEVRPRRIPRTIGRADPTATNQPGLVLRRAGARAPWRAEVVASAVSAGSDGPPAAAPCTADDERSDRTAPRRPGAYRWADLMRRTFGFDVLQCPRCGRRLRLLALIEHAGTVERILRHLGLPTDLPEPRSARAPPDRLQHSDLRWDDGATAFDAC
jgi:hypothetical protein